MTDIKTFSVYFYHYFICNAKLPLKTFITKQCMHILMKRDDGKTKIILIIKQPKTTKKFQMTSSLIQFILISLALALVSKKFVSSALFCLCCFWIIIIVIIIQHKLQREYLQRKLFLCHFMSRSWQLLKAGALISGVRGSLIQNTLGVWTNNLGYVCFEINHA